MNDWIEKKAREYYRWLSDNTEITVDPLTGWGCLATPFIDSKNDSIEIFIKRDGNKITLSDDGETLGYLEDVGITFDRAGNLKRLLESVVRNCNVTLEGSNLTVVTDEEDLFVAKHDLIQAIQQIHDLRFTDRKEVISIFSDEVSSFLEELDIIFTPNFYTQGRTRLDFVFDFQIAGRKEELLIKTYNKLHQQSVESLLFSIHDIKRARKESARKDVKSLVIINDTDTKSAAKLMRVLEEEDTRAVAWSDRSAGWKDSVFSVA